ncbi:MAG: hypothetical protein JNK05_00020 [Myxococcales bacterium]|nr:hypothetical protein [Myxococcales bacterium]
MIAVIPWMVMLGVLVCVREWRAIRRTPASSALVSRRPYREASVSDGSPDPHKPFREWASLAGIAIAPAVVMTRGFTWIAALHALFAWLFSTSEFGRDPSLLVIDCVTVCLVVALAALVHVAACRAVVGGEVEGWVLTRAYFRFAITGDLLAVGLLAMLAPQLLATYWVFALLLAVGFAHSVVLMVAAHRR